MYREKDRSENYLFKELMPFGGQLEEGLPVGREPMAEDQGADSMGRAGRGVREIFFR